MTKVNEMALRRPYPSVALAVLAALWAVAATARGVSPYLALHTSPEIERQIERLLILADKPILTRPIAAAAVFDALPKACERDAALCDQVTRYLASYMRTAGIAYAGASLSGTRGAGTAMPNRHGMNTDGAYEITAGAYWQPSDSVLATAGIVAFEGDTTPTGTMLSFGMEYAQIDLGYRDHWWSPMTDSSMLISTQAATMPSVTISNYTPISRWGLRYEAFLAEMSDSSNIAFQGGLTSGNPQLFGLHVSIQPLPGWSLGVSRIMQYGGGDREESLGEAIDAFFNPSDTDNTGTDADFGNQIASFTSRFLLPSSVPLAVYFEYAGEDTSDLNNLRLGNAALSIGVDFPLLWRNFALTVELSEWQNGWYVHSIYQDGLRNDGHVLGHWGADWREVNDGVGARSWMARLGWQPKFGGILDATYRNLDNELYSGRPYESAHELEIRYSRAWQDFYFGGELSTGSDVFGESFSRVGAFIRF
jgi:Capsule assembly protein Wzi